ncbi:MAG: hypothetical protein J5706_02870 [Elusimicrobiales bacterium]|nr:hypothetical protein [Elusimicrobiales bacterium]
MQELVNVYYSGKYGKKDMVNAYAWAAVLAARNDNVINSQAVMQQAEKEMSAAEKKKAKKTAELLIKKIGSNSYYGSISTID